jgi:S1-C subfamily serine protease
MIRPIRFAILILLSAAAAGAQEPTSAPAADAQASRAQELYDRVTPSLVAVQFSWTYEFGKVDLVGPGVVVSDDGLVLVAGDIVNPAFPDEQLTDFKIIVPGIDKDDEEIDAVFQGRDERNNVSLVKAKTAGGHTWKAIKFVDQPLTIGQHLYSVGLLAKAAGYRAFLSEGIVAAQIRGELPNVLLSGALSSIGAPVFTDDGKAIGLVNTATYDPYLHRSGGREDINPMAPILTPPKLFTQTSQFIQALNDPPTPDKPIKLSWIGLPALTGISKDVAQVFGLVNQPAIEIGDIVPDAPAALAGMKVGQKIVKINGQPLTRGDEPDELPAILHRQLLRMKIGDKVTFSVLTKKGQPLEDLTLTLGERPPEPNVVQRFYADDLGFGVREVTFDDTYRRKKPASFPGVVVTVLKPAGAAQSAKLEREDLITDLNSTPVTTLDGFKHDYQALRDDKPRDAIVLVVMKGDGTTQTIRIEPPQ